MLNEQAVLQTTSQAAAQSVLVQPGFLKIEKLAKTYVADKPVFADVSFTVARGEFVCIIGHSGCGKTTVLNVLAGLDTATEGHANGISREVSGQTTDIPCVRITNVKMLDHGQAFQPGQRTRWPNSRGRMQQAQPVR